MKLTLHFQPAPNGGIACSWIAQHGTCDPRSGFTVATMTLDKGKQVRSYEMELRGVTLVAELAPYDDADIQELLAGEPDPMAAQMVATEKQLRRAGKA